MVAALVGGGCDVRADIVGPTIGQIGESEQRAISGDAQASGVGDRVRFVGALPLDQLMRLYRDYDVFVLPTGPGEGIPRVLLEAMAAGLPIVTTRVSGITSLIRDGENGLLADDADQLVAAVRSLIESPELRRRLIQCGYATARAHTVDRQASEMMAHVRREFGIAA
jgi:glycosyltransferase involved in cell wall biosynthesis